MSIHPSLRGVNTLIGQRSVFTRVERLRKLMHDGKLSEDDSPYGLPKVRTHYKVKSKPKALDEGAEETTAAEGANGDDASSE